MTNNTTTAAGEEVHDSTSSPSPVTTNTTDHDNNNEDRQPGGGDGLLLIHEGTPRSSSSSPSRFGLWYALTVYSAVCLIALSTETDQQRWQAEEKWVLSVTLMSLVLSSLASLAHIGLRKKFVGTPLEVLLLFTELGLWVGGLIVIMDTNNMMAVDANGRISNANLYFFSWASLITTVSLFVGYEQQVNAPSIASSNVPNVGYWSGICVASLVALVSSIQIFVEGVTLRGREFNCQTGNADRGSGFCKRLKFSIALGVISLCISAACTILSFKMYYVVHSSTSFVVLFGWVLGVAFVTFGDKSPGIEVGNLYFSCWAAFVLSLFMVSRHIKDFLKSREETSRQDDQDKVLIQQEDSGEIDNKAEEMRSKPDEEVETTTQTEGPITPTSLSVEKDAQSKLEMPSDEITDPSAPLPSVEIPASEV